MSFVEIEGLANFRDLGGLPADEGHVRPRTLFRADGLHQAGDLGRADLVALGAATVIDLRTSIEYEERPGPLPVVHVPLHEDFEEGSMRDATLLVGREDGEAWLAELYRLLLATARPQFAQIVGLLADRGRLPAIVHCAGGKDRTGITVALVLSAIGVPRDVVLDDFALQVDDAEWARRRSAVHADFVSRGIEADAAAGLLSAPRWAMADALDWLDDACGGVAGYLSSCGIGATTLESLRANLVVER